MNSSVKILVDQILQYSSANSLNTKDLDSSNLKNVLNQYLQFIVSCDDKSQLKEIVFSPSNNLLHLAAKFGDHEILRELINFVKETMINGDFGGDHEFHSLQSFVNLRDQNSFTAVHYAAKFGRSEALKVLLENSAEANPPASLKDRAWTPIHYASKGGHLETVKILLQHGVSREVKTSFGLTPLLVAAEFGHLELVKFLTAEKSDINVKTTTENHEMTALHYAAVGGFVAIAETLIKAGISTEVKTSSNLTPLHFAVSSGSVEMVNLFLKCGAAHKVITQNGQDLLSFAVFKGKQNIAEVFLKWGIGDVEVATKLVKDSENKELNHLLNSYYKALNQMFSLKNLPKNLVSILSEYQSSNLFEEKIILADNVSLNAYAIVNLRWRKGLIFKKEISFAEVVNKTSNKNLSAELLRLENLINLY